MPKPTIGVIGGSGLYKMDALKNKKSVSITTPFGKPSDQYIIGTLNDKTIAFLPRHGKGHRLLPSELNYRANIYGFKKLGVTRLLSVSAVGSLKEEIAPMDVVIPHQFYDRTSKRKCTFFGKGIVAHISYAHPICMDLAETIYQSASSLNKRAHWGGTYLNMEGPQFSTQAESNVYRQWGMDIIGMTNLCEAKLAREAEICYATLSLVTDYDCWHPQHNNVTAEMIINNLIHNVKNAQQIIIQTISLITKKCKCSCRHALKDAIVTDSKLVPKKTKKDLNLIIGKYLK